jgi:hypothetical protein
MITVVAGPGVSPASRNTVISPKVTVVAGPGASPAILDTVIMDGRQRPIAECPRAQ